MYMYLLILECTVCTIVVRFTRVLVRTDTRARSDARNRDRVIVYDSSYRYRYQYCNTGRVPWRPRRNNAEQRKQAVYFFKHAKIIYLTLRPL